MELNTLSTWLWRAASSIRGEVDAARYNPVHLPATLRWQTNRGKAGGLDELIINSLRTVDCERAKYKNIMVVFHPNCRKQT